MQRVAKRGVAAQDVDRRQLRVYDSKRRCSRGEGGRVELRHHNRHAGLLERRSGLVVRLLHAAGVSVHALVEEQRDGAVRRHQALQALVRDLEDLARRHLARGEAVAHVTCARPAQQGQEEGRSPRRSVCVSVPHSKCGWWVAQVST